MEKVTGAFSGATWAALAPITPRKPTLSPLGVVAIQERWIGRVGSPAPSSKSAASGASPAVPLKRMLLETIAGAPSRESRAAAIAEGAWSVSSQSRRTASASPTGPREGWR